MPEAPILTALIDGKERATGGKAGVCLDRSGSVQCRGKCTGSRCTSCLMQCCELRSKFCSSSQVTGTCSSSQATSRTTRQDLDSSVYLWLPRVAPWGIQHAMQDCMHGTPMLTQCTCLRTVQRMLAHKVAQYHGAQAVYVSSEGVHWQWNIEPTRALMPFIFRRTAHKHGGLRRRRGQGCGPQEECCHGQGEDAFANTARCSHRLKC